MAIVTPPLESIRPATPGQHAEMEVLRQLATGLSDDFQLFHSVDWTRAQPQGDQHGELDIVVVNAAGDVAVLEVKAGAVDTQDGGLTKHYQGLAKDIAQQAQWQFGAILHRLKQEGLDVRLQHLLVLPHQRVGEQGTIRYPRERIADAEECQDLPGLIQRRLGRGVPSPTQARVAAFFDNRLRTVDDLSLVASQLHRTVQRLAGGLAEWVPRIQSPSGVVRVVGTAGSGKTQLALTLLREAAERGQSAAYVCFNRPLADQMRDAAPPAAQVGSFHQLAWAAAGRPAGAPDFAQLGEAYAQALADAEPDLDLLVVDELQDFQLPWVEAMLQRARPQARVLLLDDPNQQLYPDREELDIPQAVRVTTWDNYRSPRQVVQALNALRLSPQPIRACGPWEGQMPSFHRYQPSAGNLRRTTEAAVRELLAAGHTPEEIAVITWRGRDRSQLLTLDTLADLPLRKFTGNYDEAGQPLWTDGRLQLDSLRRTKGQAAPAVVLTEVDFDTLGELERHLLFVGMTRARMSLAVVLTEQAEQALAARLGGA